MSHIWNFAPESKSLLQICLGAAAPPDSSNKWVKQFGIKNVNLIKKSEETIVIADSPDSENSSKLKNKEEEPTTQLIEEFLDPDFDLLSKLGYFIEKCMKSPNLMVKLAENLPSDIVEKLFQHIIHSHDMENEFLAHFYRNFLPTYLKRDNTRFCTDILLLVYKKYPHYLKIALEVIFKDSEIENNVINDFILNLNPSEQTEIVTLVSGIEFNSAELLKNLFTIYTAYNTCNKTDEVQNYIFSCLKSHSNVFSYDKNYGKLMLAFLQHEKSLNRDKVSNIFEELIEVHKSPFKRPCLSVLNEIKNKK